MQSNAPSAHLKCQFFKQFGPLWALLLVLPFSLMGRPTIAEAAILCEGSHLQLSAQDEQEITQHLVNFRQSIQRMSDPKQKRLASQEFDAKLEQFLNASEDREKALQRFKNQLATATSKPQKDRFLEVQNRENKSQEVSQIDRWQKFRLLPRFTTKRIDKLVSTNDSKKIIFHNEVGEIGIFDFETRKSILLPVEVAFLNLADFAITPDGKELFVVGSEAALKEVYRIDLMAAEPKILPLPQKIRGSAFHSKLLVTADQKRLLVFGKDVTQINVFEMGSFRHEWAIPCERSKGMNISPDGKKLVNYSDFKIQMWDLDRKEPVSLPVDFITTPKKGFIREVFFSESGDRLILISETGEIKIADLRLDPVQVVTVQAPRKSDTVVYSSVVNQDFTILAVAGWQRMGSFPNSVDKGFLDVFKFDGAKWVSQNLPKPFSDPEVIHSLSLTPEGSLIVGLTQGQLQALDLETFLQPQVPYTHSPATQNPPTQNAVEKSLVVPDGSKVLTLTPSGELAIWFRDTKEAALWNP